MFFPNPRHLKVAFQQAWSSWGLPGLHYSQEPSANNIKPDTNAIMVHIWFGVHGRTEQRLWRFRNQCLSSSMDWMWANKLRLKSVKTAVLLVVRRTDLILVSMKQSTSERSNSPWPDLVPALTGGSPGKKCFWEDFASVPTVPFLGERQIWPVL